MSNLAASEIWFPSRNNKRLPFLPTQRHAAKDNATVIFVGGLRKTTEEDRVALPRRGWRWDKSYLALVLEIPS